MVPPSQAPQRSQDQGKHETQRIHELIKHEPQMQSQNDDLMNVVQLGFQVINSEKYWK